MPLRLRRRFQFWVTWCAGGGCCSEMSCVGSGLRFIRSTQERQQANNNNAVESEGAPLREKESVHLLEMYFIFFNIILNYKKSELVLTVSIP